MNLARGTLVLVDLEPTLGHEQQGTRPCVVVSDAAVNCNQRFPLIAVVPVTGTPAQGALLSSIDKQRVRRRYGDVSPKKLEPEP